MKFRITITAFIAVITVLSVVFFTRTEKQDIVATTQSLNSSLATINALAVLLTVDDFTIQGRSIVPSNGLESSMYSREKLQFFARELGDYGELIGPFTKESSEYREHVLLEATNADQGTISLSMRVINNQAQEVVGKQVIRDGEQFIDLSNVPDNQIYLYFTNRVKQITSVQPQIDTLQVVIKQPLSNENTVVQQESNSTDNDANPVGHVPTESVPGFKLHSLIDIQNSPGVTDSSLTPKQKVLQDKRFPKSIYLDDVEELNFDPTNPPHEQVFGVRIVSPDRYSSWEDAGINDSSITQFLMEPGDYRSWGSLEPTISGSPTNKRVIRYYDPRAIDPYHPVHPIKLRGTGKEVILERLVFDNVDHWTLHGLTFRGLSNDKKDFIGANGSVFKGGSDHNTLDYFASYNANHAGHFRIHTSSHVYIQNGVLMQENVLMNGDGGGVAVNAAPGEVSEDVRIVNNEFINLNDGIGLTRSSIIGNTIEDGEIKGARIENNDIYINEDAYTDGGTKACAENATDNKNITKSTLAADRALFVRNRMWGFRASDQDNCGPSGPSGSAGDAMVYQNNSRNVVVKDNIIFNSNKGINVQFASSKFPLEKTENIAIVNNLIYNISGWGDGEGAGIALQTGPGVHLFHNTIINSRKALYVHKNSENHFMCNTFINTEEVLDVAKSQNDKSISDMNAWYDYPNNDIYSPNGDENIIRNNANESKHQDLTVWLKRWTGPEPLVIPYALPGPQTPGFAMKTSNNCMLGDEGGTHWWKLGWGANWVNK